MGNQNIARTGAFAVTASMSIESLTLGHDPGVPAGRRSRRSRVIVAAAVVAGVAALALLGGPDRREPGTLSQPSTPFDVLILGDTSAGVDGCADCLTYVDQLAAALSQDGRRRVRVDDQTSAEDRAPSSMPVLLERLHSDPYLREAAYAAEVIVLAVGSGDATPRPTSARCRREQPSRCPEVTVERFRYELTAWMAETGHIRQQDPLVLRVITPPPTSGSPRQSDVARTACHVAAAHRVPCVNMYSLARTDQHVTTVDTDPLHPELTQHGHDLVAAKLIASGLP